MQVLIKKGTSLLIQMGRLNIVFILSAVLVVLIITLLKAILNSNISQFSFVQWMIDCKLLLSYKEPFFCICVLSVSAAVRNGDHFDAIIQFSSGLVVPLTVYVVLSMSGKLAFTVFLVLVMSILNLVSSKFLCNNLVNKI